MTSKQMIVGAFFAGLLSSFVGGTAGIIAASQYRTDRDQVLFVYGPLAESTTRTYACLCLTDFLAATLPGYAKTRQDIIPAPNSQVNGGLVLLSKTELARIDAYQNLSPTYQRVKIPVNKQSVWIYRTVDPKPK